MSSTCRVSFDDGAGMTHTVSNHRFEAAVLALAEFKKSGFALAEVEPGTKLKVAATLSALTRREIVTKS